jgi:protein TonB
MPAFPRDVNREAQIRVRFTVRPDGAIGAMAVLQKGEPRFEQAALAAMGSWRFNALPAGAERRDQTGVATFNFRLR